ncbi:AmpG family muropeptide MFS transporter [Acinetobacter shaoyimingii]|uniref:AmpG family muropeptide MFS transporter n=2 Tax=Acinetobacter shaoyimingii TaxID=2715164 RepID=A0A6G8RZX6_9GAMM|nr:AmpG family muropeptide MFS transporter [Acinetobacter shaoyimingii]
MNLAENNNAMTTQTTGWKTAFRAFLDRRALIMLFLGFSSGIPIFLIFSTLSFWLTEAGIQRSTITMFSWAALAYAFKFIWAPLIDKLPLPYLTQKMGKRRSWLLVSQILVTIAICAMAFTDPSPHGGTIFSIPSLTFMAMSAVFLGFTSATQDIIVDAYRIELTQDAGVQTVLASTYNAGYRIATIITQLGALLFAASLGTAMGNYIYEAWKATYLLMAALMIVGVITTFVIHEPEVKIEKNQYHAKDYLQLFVVFVVSTIIFALSFIYIGTLISGWAIEDAFLSFIAQVLRFISSIAAAVLVVFILTSTKMIDQKIVVDTWLSPILDFFKRYGLKVALAILLLIGFYRISDIVAGVVANLFYLDLNFDKEEIAWFNKFFAIFFVILGGFIGGLMAQRFNIMKMMFVGAIVASTTNLIFVGLVKSGPSMNEVSVNIGQQNLKVQPDEVGNWSLKVPADTFNDAKNIEVQSQPNGFDQALKLAIPVQTFHTSNEAKIFVQAIGGDNQLYTDERKKDVIIRGSIENLAKDAKIKLLKVKVGDSILSDAKIDGNTWSIVIPARQLNGHNSVQVSADIEKNQHITSLSTAHQFNTVDSIQPKSRMSFAELGAVQVDQNNDIELKGKVIVPYSKVWLVMGIIFDNMASGLAGAVFIAFLSSLTSVSFTAMQYAIFSSLMLLLPKMIGGYSGTIVTNFGYSTFFFMTFLMGLPILLLVVWVAKLLNQLKKS